MTYIWYIIAVLALIVFVWRRDLRPKMLASGLLSLPILFIKPLIATDFSDFAGSEGGVGLFILNRAIISFSFGVLASALYEIFFHKHLTPLHHPHRPKLLYLLAGPVLFFLLYFLLPLPVVTALIISLLVDLAILAVIRFDLIWDVIFSGAAMGTLYLIIFVTAFSALPGDINNLWFSNQLSGANVFSLPIEELVCVALFGALFGPLYVAIKDFRER